MTDPILLLGCLLIGLSFILWGIGADRCLSAPGHDIDRERQRYRSRNQF